jgi:hypothetical protein
MKYTDSKHWWEDFPQARQAYGKLCGSGWRGIQGTIISHLYHRPEPDGLFLMYYTAKFAIEDYLSTADFKRKYKKSIDELKGSKGGPQ